MGRSFEISPATLAGDLFCLLAGVLYAGYLLILQDARKALGSWALLAWSSLGSAPVLLGDRARARRAGLAAATGRRSSGWWYSAS